MSREPFGLSKEKIEEIAYHVFMKQKDEYTKGWKNQTSKYRNSFRKDIRRNLQALEYAGYSLVKIDKKEEEP